MVVFVSIQDAAFEMGGQQTKANAVDCAFFSFSPIKEVKCMHVFILVRKYARKRLEDSIIEKESFIEGVFSSVKEANTYLELYGPEYKDICWHSNTHMQQPIPLYTKKIVDSCGQVYWFILFTHEVNPHKCAIEIFAHL